MLLIVVQTPQFKTTLIQTVCAPFAIAFQMLQLLFPQLREMGKLPLLSRLDQMEIVQLLTTNTPQMELPTLHFLLQIQLLQ